MTHKERSEIEAAIYEMLVSGGDLNRAIVILCKLIGWSYMAAEFLDKCKAVTVQGEMI